MSNFNHLTELLRKIQIFLEPDAHEDFIQTLTKDGMEEHSKIHPDCFLRIGDILFPLCGKHGRKCPNMLTFSLKMAQRLIGTDAVDQEALAIITQKLERLKGRYEKEVPTSISGAVKKAQSTRKFNMNMR